MQSARFLPIARQLAVQRPVSAPAAVWRAGARRAFATRSPLMVKKYTQDHEWIELDADGKTGTIGITEYAANALGDVVYVELPELGLEMAKSDPIGAVESVKSASDIHSPMSGTVTEVNETLSDKPITISKQPLGDGWFAKIEVSDAKEFDSLMTAEEYDAFEK